MGIKLKGKRDKKVKQKVKSLRTKLIIMIGVVLFTAIAILSVVSLTISGKSIKKETEQKLATGVNGISETLHYRIKAAINELYTYSENEDLAELLLISQDEINKGGDRVKILQNMFNERFLEERDNNEDVLNMYAMNKEGIIYSSVFPDAVGTDVSERDYFTRVMNNEEMVISDVVESSRLQANVNMISTGVYKDGELIGVITSVLGTSAYEQIIEEYRKDSLDGFITDNKGNLVFHPNKELIGLPFDNKDVNDIATGNVGDNGVVEYTSNGVKDIAAYDTIKEIGWKVFTYGSVKDIYKPVTKLQVSLLGISIVLLSIATVIIYLLSVSISAPIKKMTGQVNKIAEGDLTIRVDESTSSNEILNLSRGFNTMIDNLSVLINETLATVQKVEDASTNLCAISEEVSASNSEITKQVAMIFDSTTKQATDAQLSSEKTIGLGNSIEELESKNEKMGNQGQLVASSLVVSTKKINYLSESNDKSRESFKAVKNTVEEMISQISNISNIIKVIDKISAQTSLLSLNASIESARAGEAGRGFAVVATEIRGLADEVQGATNDISSIIRNIQGIVEVTKRTLVESEKISDGQVGAYKEVEDAFKTMEVALNDMINITRSISKDVDGVNNKKNEVLKSIGDVAAEAEDVAAVTAEVNQSIEEQSIAFDNVSVSAEELIDLSQNVKVSIGKFNI
ncbi:MAG: methyl-accepting chemotaxis protein [Clostridium sp.]|uniref:methyl-accepting chemotaxis protein n=1 Tax=Clostridium sp. TaxID=1506 RepID=UPI0030350285